MSFVRLCGTDDRSAWLAARRIGIGASEAPSLFGLGFRSALEVYSEKLGLGEEREDTPELRWGRKLEALILDEFAAETGRRVAHGGQLLQSREWPWMLCTLDAEQVCPKRPDPGLVEAKATRWLAGEWSEGEPPRRVWIQVQQQLAVTGRAWGSVAVLLFGSRFLWCDVERDDAFIRDVLVPAGEEFWKRVQERRPVPPDGSESAKRALRELYPEHTPGKIVNLGGDLIEFDQEREQLRVDVKLAQERIDEIDQALRMAIGDAEAGTLANGVTYTHKLQKRAEYTVKAAEFRVLRRVGGRGV